MQINGATGAFQSSPCPLAYHRHYQPAYLGPESYVKQLIKAERAWD